MQDNKKEKFISALIEIIKTHRNDINKSIYTISAESGVPRSTWRDIEFGLSSDINLTNFCKIAEGLDIPAYELLKEVFDKLGKDFSFTDL